MGFLHTIVYCIRDFRRFDLLNTCNTSMKRLIKFEDAILTRAAQYMFAAKQCGCNITVEQNIAIL